jgi:hypothetical protein
MFTLGRGGLLFCWRYRTCSRVLCFPSRARAEYEVGAGSLSCSTLYISGAGGFGNDNCRSGASTGGFGNDSCRSGASTGVKSSGPYLSLDTSFWRALGALEMSGDESFPLCVPGDRYDSRCASCVGGERAGFLGGGSSSA